MSTKLQMVKPRLLKFPQTRKKTKPQTLRDIPQLLQRKMGLRRALRAQRMILPSLRKTIQVLCQLRTALLRAQAMMMRLCHRVTALRGQKVRRTRI